MQQKIIEDLQRIGVHCGDVLFAHSSLSALGWVDGGCKTVIEALLSTLGEKGTLLMPAFSYATTSVPPYYFSMKDSVCCVGSIPEYFRHMEGVMRSGSPTHSICGYGKNAKELLKYHALDQTPVGPNSPLSLLKNYDGKILFLGCDLNSNTMMHGVEEAAGAPYVLLDRADIYTIETLDLSLKKQEYFRHDFSGYRQCYSRLESLLEPEFLHKGKVMAADSILINAKAAWYTALQKMTEDPLYFVQKLEET